ncbi:E3 ubiquitin ligase BIG BROTHER-related-like [Solanum dulcamara]|uniref:E3 ubiquitin ligase BIG BROTHER-related-like n=1 Tax=Solanum dulcamara TaxID=45834 RepID=UPI0024859D1F|nr:E3 ubiquitin ligase BIG BROTHER-related-like [Solanum dulcamara]
MSDVPCSTLPPDVYYLNRLQQRLQQQPRVDLSRFKFEDSNLGDIEEEAEEFEDVLHHSFHQEIMEEDEEEVEEIANDEWILDYSLDEEIIEEEEDFEVDISENMETTMESGNYQVSEFVQTGMEYDIHLLNEGYQQQQGLNQTSGRRSRTARMRVNTNYIHYRIQVPQPILDDTYSNEIEDEEEEDAINEFVDQDMSEYFETSTYYVPSVMDIDVNEIADDEDEEACAICLLEYKDEDTIATLQCGHEFHTECINKWLQRKKACPFCRASVLPTNT